MTPEQIERVFGHGRLKMVTGEHVEVFREAVVPGERRRYTKRFLNSTDGDFAHWTEREWRILARLIGHGIGCVPDVVQFDRGSVKGAQLVQTYDAGVTVDQWATLLPLNRDGHVYRHAFEDCAHWWALAHYCLAALKEIHQLQLVHLDIKGDNVCIPFGPANFDPEAAGTTLYPLFGQLALIDFAFSLVSGESLKVALPIGWQREYDYQSPRLLQALVEGHDGNLTKTRELDWRCDIYSLAAMLKRYLPNVVTARPPERVTGWTSGRYDAAKMLILSLRHHHDAELPLGLPHQAMIDTTGAMLRESDLAQSLAAGWTLARDVTLESGVAAPITPMTRIAPPIRVFRKPRERALSSVHATNEPALPTGVSFMVTRRNDVPPAPSRRNDAAPVALAAAFALVLGAAVAHQAFPDAARKLSDGARTLLDDGGRRDGGTSSALAERATPDPAATRSSDSDRPSPVNAGAKVAENTVDSVPKVAAAEPPANAGPARTTDVPPAAANEDAEDGSERGNAESRDAGAPVPVPKADGALSPPVSRMSPRAALPAESARGAKRPPTKSAPLPSARPAAPATMAKSAPGRVPTLAAPRSSPSMVASNSSAGSASAEGARVVTAPAPAQVIELVLPETQKTPALSSPASTPQSGETVPSSTLAAGQAQESAAAPKSSTATRRTRAASANDEWRAGINALSQFLGFTKRKAAPIEDRTFQEVTPAAKPSRPPQSVAPVPESSVSAPRIEAPVFTPRIEAPPPLAMATPPPLPMTTPLSRTLPPPPTRESDFAQQGRRALAQSVPRTAVQTQAEIAPVLWAASKAQDQRAEREVVDSAQAVWVRDGTTAYSQAVDAATARRLNEEAMQAYWVRRNIPEALELSLKAFGANPNDPEVAGNLAFLHLRVNPAQPETARQLALHAIAVRGTRFRSGRLEDWNTYALASALTGRDADARNAMYVTLALAGSVERNCKAGLNAIANYGERVREPVEAMLYRIYTQGRAYESPYCAWPPNWAMGMRRQ